MPFYVADYLADTGHLSTIEHGAYMLLIMHYWQHEGLPTEDEDLAIIARLTGKDWQRMRNKLARFFQDGWRHKRIDAELHDAESKYEKRVQAGKLGGKAKAKRLALERQTTQQTASNASSNATPDASSKRLADRYQPQPHTPYPSREEPLRLGTLSTGRGSVGPPANGSGQADDWDDGAPFGSDADAA